MATKSELEARIKELEIENEKLQMQFVRGKTIDLKDCAASFSYNGDIARVQLVNNGDLIVSSNEKVLMIEPISSNSFQLHFK